MTPLYPLTFQPLFKRYLWGGRRLGELLNKPIGAGDDYAESWEVSDHAQGQSIVASGPLAGTSLHELVASRGSELLGRHAPLPRFPLLFKYLDCQRDLSVQVHPNDAAAALLNPPDLGKTEAWVILHAEPGSRIYAGLKAGCDNRALEDAIQRGTVATYLHSFLAEPGQCIFIPAGTVHALGAGLVVAEIQQASDTTYRLYDWNRVGPDGQPRKLHINESLAAIDYSATDVTPQRPEKTSDPRIKRLVACDKFILDRLAWSGQLNLQPADRFHILSVLEGPLTLAASPNVTLAKGQTVLIPACLGQASLIAPSAAVALDIYLPS
jgi:mannose-6-phosphate isomerase